MVALTPNVRKKHPGTSEVLLPTLSIPEIQVQWVWNGAQDEALFYKLSSQLSDKRGGILKATALRFLLQSFPVPTQH